MAFTAAGCSWLSVPLGFVFIPPEEDENVLVVFYSEIRWRVSPTLDD